MSLFGRALAGAGQGAASVASDYINEQLAEQRAQVLSDIQRNSAVQLDQYQNSPERQAQLASNAAASTITAAGATDQAALNTASNTPLTQAAIARANAVTSGTAAADAAAAGAKQGAITANQAHDVAPGGQVIIGAGSNTTPTAAQLALQMAQEGLKGKAGEQRDEVYKSQADNLAKLAESLQATINKGQADGTIHTTPPPPKTHMFGADEPGVDPAYTAYQNLQQQLATVKAQQAAIYSAWHAERDSKTPGSATGAGLPPTPPAITQLRQGQLGDGAPNPAAPANSPGVGQQPGDTSDTAPVMRSAAQDMLRQLADPSLPAAQRTKTESDLATLVSSAAQSGISMDLDKLKAGVVAPASALSLAAAAKPSLADSAAARMVSSTAAAAAAPGTAAAALAAKDAKGLPAQIANKVQAWHDDFTGAQADAALTRASFDKDIATMSPTDIVAKYGPVKDRLSIMQAVQLARLMGKN